VAVNTHEEARFSRAVVKAFANRSVYGISAVGGLRDLKTGTVPQADANFVKAIQFVAGRTDSILLVFDLQHILHNAPIYRALKDVMPSLKGKSSMVVLVAPHWKLPAELQYDVTVLDWGLPTREELDTALDAVSRSVQKVVPASDRPLLLDAAAGLAFEQAENAYSIAYVEKANFDPIRVTDEKVKMVKAGGLLEVWAPTDPSQIGGLGAFKSYLETEVLPWKNDNQLRTKGILMVGVPGTGKSLSMKACGAMLGWPILRMDVASLKGSLVGQSEQNMRNALKLTSSIAPCILGMDELEKGIGGYQSSAVTDSGVTLGMLGTLLTWMQENTQPVLVVATCNDYSKLPPELVRRFDTSWFMDLPRAQERRAIAEIHFLDIKCRYDGGILDKVVQVSDNYTGDEIRQLVLSSARQSNRNPTAALVEKIALNIKPIAVSRSSDIDRLRQWAEQSIRIANTAEEGPTSTRRLKRADAQG
jgi:hypothetical protein